ncbi:uncharacterized protein LOC121385915 [Gigantopelta aegis]|uniref:uncharacterized protein LOC121385915 n=1 Tax=Gigantopelta aegis TaxID=1735272 RepID=UPI001B88B8A1|nr:uncharacterized protein LOC121385915 [Gigantopelta aegis]
MGCVQSCFEDDRCVLFRFEDNGNCSTFCDTGMDKGVTPEYGSDANVTTAKAIGACPKPPALPNGHVVYNSRRVNSVANYSCNEDFKFFGLSLMSVCDVTGSWNVLNGSCARVAFYNVTLVFISLIPEIVRPGWKVEIFGTPLNESRMSFNLECGIVFVALHFDVRFQHKSYRNIALRTSRTDGVKWDRRDVDQPYFPFAVGRPFNLTIQVTASGFDMYVDNDWHVFRNHSTDLTRIGRFIIKRGGVIQSVKFFN